MDLIKANPDIETLKLVLWIATGVIVLLIGVVSTLIGIYFSGQKKRMDDFEQVQDIQSKEFSDLVNTIRRKQDTQHETMQEIVSSMKDTLSELKTLVRIMEDRQTGAGKLCTEKHQLIDRRLTEHGVTIDKHETRITVLEMKVKNQ
jgi:SMC interacting uncharacterized protein involved in chromosome segregation